MILNNAPSNEAVLSNIGSVNSFTIKATAKSFQILSSGLYANKIKSIIRELSCNALDSHVANGNPEIPFVVHLPTALEPYFSVRDFGTGLSHEQVVNIFTTFFESTKTHSNDFVGALGLGSKSPFSYTDNFTVTAIQNGKRGIYTAFISDTGVPSIALMYEESTLEDNGVEVKFAVTDRYDFSKFRDEARAVYKYFRARPAITGVTDFEFEDPQYETKNIIPGVHQSQNNLRNSTAIMGNIAYPIDIPNHEQLGDLASLLQCGLVMEFEIGELDFQASREGLSYIPQTIEAIKRKLTALNAHLATFIAEDADKIENLWERAIYLSKKRDQFLWKAAIDKYVEDTQFALANRDSTHRWDFLHTFKLGVEELKTEYNIVIRSFTRQRHQNVCGTVKVNSEYNHLTQRTTCHWRIRVDSDNYFVFNDTKVGALERAKYHWRLRSMPTYTETVYVIEAYDKTLPIKQTEFLSLISNPPANRVMISSDLEQKERAASNLGKNVTILRLEERQRSYYQRNAELVWADAGTADSFDANKTYYYLPLSGFQSLGRVEDVKNLRNQLKNSKIHTGEVYGVRKSNMDWIKTQSNWVNLDDFVLGELNKMGAQNIKELVKQAIDFGSYFCYTSVITQLNAASPYAVLYNEFKDVEDIDTEVRHGMEYLCGAYSVSTSTNVDPTEEIAEYRKQLADVKSRYPLLGAISKWSVTEESVAEYINAIDQVKGI